MKFTPEKTGIRHNNFWSGELDWRNIKGFPFYLCVYEMQGRLRDRGIERTGDQIVEGVFLWAKRKKKRSEGWVTTAFQDCRFCPADFMEAIRDPELENLEETA